jgi:hypothetical protein
MPDTSIIDDKKKQKTPDPQKELLSFFSGIFSQLIVFGILILIGALCLYSGKVAQTNILPTCLSLSPYSDATPQIDQIKVDINVVKTDKGIWSTKLEFPLQENLKIIDNTLGVLKSWTNGPNTNVYKLYIATTLQQLIALNFTITNSVNNFMNSMLTETWFILLSPYILFFTSILTSIINFVYFTILWFYNIYLLFSKKEDETGWKDGEMWSAFNFGWSILYIFIFCILFFTIGAGLILPITTFLVSAFCVIFPLFMKSKNSQTGKQYGLGETIKNVLKYKLNIIMIILSLYIISSANSNFGGYSALVAILACVILYFFTSVYHQYIPKATDHATFGLGDYVQANKKCIPVTIAEGPPSMFDKIGKLFGGSKRGKR